MQGDPRVTTQLFTWTDNGNDVRRYKFWLGSTPGGKDIYKIVLKGSVTSATASFLPLTGGPVYARLLWWDSGWQSSTKQFTLASPP